MIRLASINARRWSGSNRGSGYIIETGLPGGGAYAKIGPMKPPDAKKTRPVLNLVPLAVILFGFALRLYKLGAQSLWYDETVSAFLAAEPARELIAHTSWDIHPPAYYLLLHFWSRAAGPTEFALAFFSLVFGVLLIPLTYRLARHLINRQAASWAALLLAASPYNVWYSQEVRMYTLGAALGLTAAYCVLRGFDSTLATRKIIWWWLGYVFLAALGLYTLYYFAFLLVVLNLLFLVFIWVENVGAAKTLKVLKTLRVWILVLANLGVFVAYLPWLPIAWRQATHPPVPPWRSSSGGSLWPLVESWSALSLGQSVEPAVGWPILFLTLALFGLGVRYVNHGGRLRRSTGLFLGLYTLGPLLLIYLLSFLTPLYHVRYIFTYSPPFYILLGAGLAGLGSRVRWGAVAAVSLLLATSFFSIYQLHFDARYRADDYRAAVDFIQRRWQPGDVIMTNAGYVYTTFEYYADLPRLQRQRLVPYRPPTDLSQPLLLQTGTVNGDPQLGWGDPRSDFFAMSEAETLAALEKMSADFSRLWLLRAYDTVTDPAFVIRTWLAEHTIPIEDQVFSGESQIRAQGFILDGTPQPANERVEFADGLALAGWELPGGTWQPGQTIHLKLWWLASTHPTTDYKMSLKMWTPSGELAAQGEDTWPVGGLYRATAWPLGQVVYHPVQLTLPPNLPPGQYWLNVELYHPDTLLPLPRLDGRDPVVTLGSVQVAF